MAKKFVILKTTLVSFRTCKQNEPITHYVPANALFIDCKGLHGELHTVKTCGLPNEVSNESMGDIGRDSVGPPQLERNLVRYICKVNE